MCICVYLCVFVNLCFVDLQVFAVEFTGMANHARRLVAKNGMEDVVEVIQTSVEDLQLDGKVGGWVGWVGECLFRWASVCFGGQMFAWGGGWVKRVGRW